MRAAGQNAAEYAQCVRAAIELLSMEQTGLLGLVSIHVIPLSHRGLTSAFDRVALCKALIPVPGTGRKYGFKGRR